MTEQEAEKLAEDALDYMLDKARDLSTPEFFDYLRNVQSLLDTQIQTTEEDLKDNL